MLKKYYKFIFSGLLALALFFNCLLISSPVNATTAQDDLRSQLNTAGIEGWGAPATSTTLPKIIQYVISTFLGLLGIIFLVLIIYSGYNWMTAAGDEEKVTLAKQTLTRAVIGLVIIIAAYSITYFVFTNLPGGSGNSGFGR